MKTLLLLLLLLPCVALSQSNQIKYIDLEKAMKLDDLKLEDYLFLKGYKFDGKKKHILIDNGVEYCYSKEKTIDDFSSVNRTRYLKQIYSIQYQTYSLVEFDNMRKSVIGLGYNRVPDEGKIICYDTKTLSIGFASTKDEDGDTIYSVFISDRAVDPFAELPKKSQ